MPAARQVNRYLFRFYGVDDFIRIPVGSTKNTLLPVMHGPILHYGKTEAVASRSPFPQETH